MPLESRLIIHSEQVLWFPIRFHAHQSPSDMGLLNHVANHDGVAIPL